MSRARVFAALLGAVLVVGIAAPVGAQSKCNALKLKATGKKTLKKLVCHAKAVAKGEVLDADCLQRAEDKFADAFAKAEGKNDCIDLNGDAGSIEAEVDALVDDVASDLGGPGPSKCTKKKLLAAGKKTLGKAKCHAKAAGQGSDVDAACLTKAEDKFDNAFTNAEAVADCAAPTGDAGAIEAKIDAFITDMVATLDPPPCDLDSGTFTCGGGCPPGNICVSSGGAGNCACFPPNFLCGTACGPAAGCPGGDAGLRCEGPAPGCGCCLVAGRPCANPGDCCSASCVANSCM
jgi:hypothetical protein